MLCFLRVCYVFLYSMITHVPSGAQYSYARIAGTTVIGRSCCQQVHRPCLRDHAVQYRCSTSTCGTAPVKKGMQFDIVMWSSIQGYDDAMKDHLLFWILLTVSAAAALQDQTISWDQLLTHKVFAFYYLWYGDVATDGRYQHWDHEVLPHWNIRERDKYPHGSRFTPPSSIHAPYYPLRGPYSSSNPDVIQEHIKEMLDSNITVMVVSWWGPEWRPGTHDTQGVNTDKVLQRVVEEVEKQQLLKIAFHLEHYEGRTAAMVGEDLQHLMSRYANSNALLRVNGKPVYFMYDSYRVPPADWAEMLSPHGNATVRGTDLDGVFIALLLELKDGEAIVSGGFDGFYTYFASDAVSFASNPDNWPSLGRWARAHHQLFVASVGPGYDDSRIRPWNTGATRSREAGDRYRRYWASAQSSGAHAVSITSYNEWGEGTQIEPVQPWVDADTGKRYLDYGKDGPQAYMMITAECASQFISARQYSYATLDGGSTEFDSSIRVDEVQEANEHQEL